MADTEAAAMTAEGRRNEAADRLRETLTARKEWLDAALAEERRITVERIQERLDAYNPIKPGWGYWRTVFEAILDWASR